MLNTMVNQDVNITEKFQSGERLWFWFLYTKSIQNGFNRNHATIRRSLHYKKIPMQYQKPTKNLLSKPGQKPPCWMPMY